ncbi:hypothetical protein [Bradyrhizobium yuanmingense]|uniref:hypothetical protein n=1 Tax=Bradyrhizobium yuanmingense TaxID=108015 RepID=UPI001FDA5B9B|nr:hypothetical protein [Bradyrhizobium yuanmingense]
MYTLAEKIWSTSVSGLTVIGGKGGFRFEALKENVSGLHTFADCSFYEYTECAIGNNSKDHPYLKVSRCVFFGAASTSTVGIAWGGYVDGLAIENCAFLLNAYHLKIGPRLSGSISITRNDFIAFAHSHKRADIWIVPNNTDKHGVNAGVGFVISENKFGNENMDATDSRILVAEEEVLPGRDRLSSRPVEASSTGFLSNLEVCRNRIEGISGLAAPFIRVFIERIWRLNFYHNVISGGRHTFLAEFQAPRSSAGSNSVATWTVDLSSSAPDGLPPFSMDVTNRYIGLLHDQFGLLGGSTWNQSSNPVGIDADLSLLLDAPEEGRYLVDGGNKLPVTNKLGNQGQAVQIAVIRDNPSASVSLRLDPPSRFQPAWLDADIKRAEKRSVSAINLEVRNDLGDVALKRVVRLPPSWQPIRLPFVFPTDTGSWKLIIRPVSARLGTEDQFCLGRIRVYNAKQPVKWEHVGTMGSGAWDGEHLILGRTHIWISSDGSIRYKSSKPLSDGDGRLISSV